jgi:hypothetical protein
MCIGTASITRSKTATTEAIFWQAIKHFVIRAPTTSLVLRPEIALARIKTGVPSHLSDRQDQRAVQVRAFKGVVENQKSEGTGSNSAIDMTL